MKYICPLIVVSDIEKSRHFYENILNQKVKYDFGENVTFHGDFAIHLQAHYRGLIENKSIQNRGNNFELYFEHDEIDEMVDKLKEHDVSFIHQTREEPWRQKVARFYDPDMHIIEIGESFEHLTKRLHDDGMTIEQISKAIQMPVDFVKDIIEA